jgi:hypothetical protein
MESGEPLRTLYDLNPIPLWNRDGGSNEPYMEDSVVEFIESVEYKIADLIEHSNDDPAIPRETNILSTIKVNGNRIELSKDTAQPEPYCVETSKDGVNTFSLRAAALPAALEAYSVQINEQAVTLLREMDGKPPLTVMTSEYCLPDSKNADFTGKLIIIDVNALKPEYRNSESAIVHCTHGNGARPGAKGRSVFCKELYSGESVVYDRSEILGVADERKLPEWANEKLKIQRETQGKEPMKTTPPKAPNIPEKPQKKPSLLNDLDAAIAEAAQIAGRKSGSHVKKHGDREVD